MTDDSFNDREREKVERRLRELKLRPVHAGPRCIVCQAPLSPLSGEWLCQACDGD